MLASRRPPSAITPGPHGSWPLRFDRLVQPVLDAQCVSCHRPDSGDALAAKFDLRPEKAYESLAGYGQPSLREVVLEAYRKGVSTEGRSLARLSPILALFDPADGHRGVRLDMDARSRLITWLDTYGQRTGSFGEDQERRLVALKNALPDLFE